MTDRPVVSVVTPTLNQARYLEQTLASLRAQAYGRVEHIVMDGGSDDGTLEILDREAKAGRLRYVTERDHGMYDAINKGLALATGDILAYLNSDDAWFPWTLETVVRTFESRLDADVVFGDGIKVNEADGTQRLRLFPPFDRVSLANYESICQPAVFWRRRLYERIGGFDATMRYVADLDYWLRASEGGAVIVHVPEVIAIERLHAARLSSAHQDAMAAEDRAMRTKHAGDRGGPEGRERAVNRDEGWQRWLWVRFMTAVAIRPFGTPWRNFIRFGRLRVRGRQIINGIKRYHHTRLWNAVSSPLAAEILGEIPAAHPDSSVVKRAIQRARLATVAFVLLPLTRAQRDSR